MAGFCFHAPTSLGKITPSANVTKDPNLCTNTNRGPRLSYNAGARASTSIARPTQLVPSRIADPSPTKTSVPRRYRAARLDESETLLTFYNSKKLLSPRLEDLELWIRKEQVLVAIQEGTEEVPIGMMRAYFAGDSSERHSLTDQFGLSKPLQVLEWGDSTAKDQSSVQLSEVMKSEYSVDVENMELFYCSSFSVIESERRGTTAFRLGEYSLFQFLPLLQSLKRNLTLDGQRSTRKQIGLLFGTSPGDTLVRRMAIQVWKRLLQSVWNEDTVSLKYVVFEHTRPDGMSAIGNLLLFDCSN